MTTGWRTLRIGLASLVTAAMLGATWIPLSVAGSAADPEVRDAVADANPAAIAVNTPENGPLFENMTAYDIVAAWVALESATDFWIFIQVHDLPDDWGVAGEPPSQSPFGANASFSGTSLVANFTVAGVEYRAIAKMAEISDGGLMDNYSLWKGPQWAPLSGSYDVESDLVSMRLPKEAFAGLQDGIELERFWAAGRFGDRTMDYAPDARDIATGSTDPAVILGQLETGQITVEPRYGRDYLFGQYYHPPGSGGTTSTSAPGPQPTLPDLALSIVGTSERSISPGESTIYELRVQNKAAKEDVAYLVLSSGQEGWSHRLSASQLELRPGEVKDVFLTVVASETAKGSLASRVDASSALGAVKSESVLTRIVSGGGGASPEPEDGSVSPVAPPKGKSPGPELGLMALAVVGAALALRRRRD